MAEGIDDVPNVDQLAYIHQAELLAEASNERLIRSIRKDAGNPSLGARLIARFSTRTTKVTANERTSAI